MIAGPYIVVDEEGGLRALDNSCMSIRSCAVGLEARLSICDSRLDDGSLLSIVGLGNDLFLFWDDDVEANGLSMVFSNMWSVGHRRWQEIGLPAIGWAVKLGPWLYANTRMQ